MEARNESQEVGPDLGDTRDADLGDFCLSQLQPVLASINIPEMDRPDSQSRGAVVSNENEVLGGTKQKLC